MSDQTTETINSPENTEQVNEATPIIDDSVVEQTTEVQPVTSLDEQIEIDENDSIQQKVTLSHPLDLEHKLTDGEVIDLPTDYDKQTRHVLERLPATNLLDTPDGREWAEVLAKGLELNTYNEAFVPTLEDQESEWNNKVENNGINLTAAAPKFKAVENENLKGDRAILRVITHLGLGTTFQVPLWHSGLWVTFRPPSEGEIVELHRQLMATKIDLGRYTYGLAFANTVSYTTDTLMEFAVRHIYDMSAKLESGITAETIRSHISCQDIPSFLWGFVCTMYPKGFRYRRACIADPLKCNHIVEETLNVSKLQVVNTKGLTEWQKTFMSGRQSKSRDIESINRYKEELNKIQKKRVEIVREGVGSIFITLRSPNVSQYVEAGHRWIGNIVNTVDRALDSDTTDAERNAIVVQHGQATSMHQYSHWVDSIELNNNIIDDEETIEKTLDTLSADDEIRVKFITSVVDYINSSTISVIGIPVFDCPSCKNTQESIMNDTEFKNVLPLDMIQLFFGLLTQRLERIKTR